MKANDIYKVFGLSVFNDKVLRTDEDILRVIKNCKKLTDSMRVEESEMIKHYRKAR